MTDLLSTLPPHLRERARLQGNVASPTDAPYILYWMRVAQRAHDNPALDTALALSRALERPAFVYQGLAESYPFASDRHHTFILEGARDVADELAARDIGYAFHLEREGARGSHLATLAAGAAAVVTEEMPVDPLARWTRELAARVEVPIVSVDASCVVPMPSTERAHDRAYAFRRATEALRHERLERPWLDLEPPHPRFSPDLPFTPLDLADADIPTLVGQCAIDHAVPPVAHTPGGSRAGYARWRRFRRDRLRRYARDRNDPLRDGVSRLSPYLHYGMISPLRLAREAAAEDSDGARKFLDELLVWRELAWHFCYHQPQHASTEALPAWSRETLRRHESDPRPDLPSWETLARGRTGEALWDAAQTSLLIHGELHNNVRMTWGKALLSWTRDAGEALALLEDLNHRYALDGRDPSSYGGLLWCLGLFDRPFKPEKPILGTVRPRPTRAHARRIDLERYRERARAPAIVLPPSVLVIGGGIAGLACARTLSDAGLPVTVVDKGRRPAGRTSTRRRGKASFDHGAQYFTARDERFARYVRSWRHDGVAAPWTGRIRTLESGRIGAVNGSTRRWVGVPGMSAVARHLASDLELRSGVRIETLRPGARWIAVHAEGEEAADVVVVALPAPQATELLRGAHPFAERVAEVEMAPAWAVMAGFPRAVDLPLDGAFVTGSPLSWVARDSSKPGRPTGERWVLHAGPAWSREQLEASPETISGQLLTAFEEAAGVRLPTPNHLAAHRWRYALAETPLEEDCLWDGAGRLGVCGDWCPGARVEGAFLSGVALAGAILRDCNR